MRAGPENRNRVSRMPARLRSASDPSLMIFDSGVPSIHSLTSTWSVPVITGGT